MKPIRLLLSLVFLLFLLPLSGQDFTEVARILAPDGGSYNKFAHTVNIDGGYALAGTYRNGLDENETNPMQNAGAAYFMKKDDMGNWAIVQKVVASDRAPEDRFATMTALSGRYAMIGAPNEENGSGITPKTDDGSVYVFWLNDEGIWTEVQKLEVPAQNAKFGFPIHLDGNRAIIAAREKTIYYRDEFNQPKFHKDAGGAYVFELQPNGQWELTATLDYSDHEASDNFGKGLYFYGDYAVLGCPKKSFKTQFNSEIDGVGAIYIFKKQIDGTWLEIKKIIPSNIAADLSYGESVVMNNEFIVVGTQHEAVADGSGNFAQNAGVVYVYKKKQNEDDWEEFQILNADPPYQNGIFGDDVQLKDNTLIVGAPRTSVYDAENDAWYAGGVCYVFKRGTTGEWEQTQVVTGSSVNSFDDFGQHSSFDGTTLIVGAWDHIGADNATSRMGAAFIYELDGGPIPDIEINVAALRDVSESDTDSWFTFTLSESLPQDTQINYTIGGSATNGSDYASIGNSIIIPSGQTEYVLPISAIDDTVLEAGGENIVITLESATNDVEIGSEPTATIHIADNDTVEVNIAATQSGSENGQDGSFTVTLSESILENTEITYTISGSATNGNDYELISNSMTIPSGQTQFVLPILAIDDTVIETGGETISLTLETASNGVLIGSDATASIRIADNDTVIEANIVALQSASESGQDGLFTVTLSKSIPENTEIAYTVSGNAEEGFDYDPLSGTVTIPMNTNSVSIPIQIIDDNEVEVEAEQLTLVLENTDNEVVVGINNSASMGITDNDISEVSIVAIEDASEDGASGLFQVTLSKPINQDVSLDFTLSGTAELESDFTVSATNLVIPKNTTSAELSIYAIDDDIVETDIENIIISLESEYEYLTITSNSQATLAILDNDDSIVEEPSDAQEPIVYPNPTYGEFNIDFGPQGTDNVIIEIFDSVGKRVYSETPPDGQRTLNIKGILAQGTYTIQIWVNTKITTKRLIRL